MGLSGGGKKTVAVGRTCSKWCSWRKKTKTSLRLVKDSGSQNREEATEGLVEPVSLDIREGKGKPHLFEFISAGKKRKGNERGQASGRKSGSKTSGGQGVDTGRWGLVRERAVKLL